MLRVVSTLVLCLCLAATVACDKRRVTTNIHDTDMGADAGETDMGTATDMSSDTDGSVVRDLGVVPRDMGADAGSVPTAELVACDLVPAAEIEMSFTGGFTPADTGIADGQVARFTNSDPFPHTITSTSGETVVPSADGRFDFDVAGGATVCIRFNRTGSYPYFCEIHTSMRGQIVVGASETGDP